MSGPDTRAVEALQAEQALAAKRKEQSERIRNGEAAAGDIKEFLSYATDEQKQEIYDHFGINIENFYDNIAREVGEYIPSGDTQPISSAPNYNLDTVIIAVRGQKEDVDKILQGYLIVNADSNNVFIPFDEYISTGDGDPAVTALVKKLTAREDWGYLVAKFFGVEAPDNPNSTIAFNRIADIVDETTEPDDEALEKKAEDLLDSTAKQCILLQPQLLYPLSVLCDQALKVKCTTEVANARDANQQIKILSGIPYSGRIIKLDVDQPSTLINYLSNIPGINENLTNLDQRDHADLNEGQLVTNYRLSMVKKHDGQIIELPVFYKGEFNFNTSENGNINLESNAGVPSAGTPIVSDDDDDSLGSVRSTSSEESAVRVAPSAAFQNFIDPAVHQLDINVTYQGTNPSTYRNDVDVTITIGGPSLSLFTKTWTYPGIVDSQENPIKYSLFDLILFPYLEKDTDGYGRVFKSQYSPNYNRIRLAYLSNFKNIPQGAPVTTKSFYDKNTNVLDLAIIDHELKRDEEGTIYQLVLNYKGYVQSALTSPETDILSTPEIKDIREKRDVLLRKAIEKNCSLREIQEIQAQLNNRAKNDVKDVSSSLIAKLFVRSQFDHIKGLGIYKLNLDQALVRALRTDGELNIDQVKKRIVDPNNNAIAQTIGTSDISTLATAIDKPEQLGSRSQRSLYYFYLADLLDAAILNSGIYENKNAYDDSPNTKYLSQQLRFIMGSFVTPDNKVMNIGNIPISLDFFVDWYKENVTQKELFIYPCLSFIRDITEKVVTNLLNEVCFEGLDETKLLVRTSFFPGIKDGKMISKKDDVYSLYRIFFEESEKGNVNLSKIALSKDTDLPLIKTNFFENAGRYINFCAIYTRENRQIRSIERNVEIPEFKLEYTPIKYGASKANFSRVQQTGLRESRYARNSSSGITMLAAVYNVDLTLTHPIHTIYPGQFFKIDVFSDPDSDIVVAGVSRSIFTELGLNGYYVVTKVATTIDIDADKCSTKISGIFVGTDNPYSVRLSTADTISSIQNPSIEAKNNACNQYVEFAQEIGVAEATGGIGSVLRRIGEITDQIAQQLQEIAVNEEEEEIRSQESTNQTPFLDSGDEETELDVDDVPTSSQPLT